MGDWVDYDEWKRALRKATGATMERFADYASYEPFMALVETLIQQYGLSIDPSLDAHENERRVRRVGEFKGWPKNEERMKINAFFCANGIPPAWVGAYYRAMCRFYNPEYDWEREYKQSVLSQAVANYANLKLYGYNVAAKKLVGDVPEKYAGDEAERHFQQKAWQRDMRAQAVENQAVLEKVARLAKRDAAKEKYDRRQRAIQAKAAWEKSFLESCLNLQDEPDSMSGCAPAAMEQGSSRGVDAMEL